jgi:hypothetical protein
LYELVTNINIYRLGPPNGLLGELPNPELPKGLGFEFALPKLPPPPNEEPNEEKLLVLPEGAPSP